MSKVVLLLLATSAGLGLLSLHLVKQLKDGDATIAGLQAQVATLEEQQSQLAATLARSATAEVDAHAGDAVTAVATIVPRTAPAQKANANASALAPPTLRREDHLRMMRQQREQQRQLMQDPEYREAMRLQARNNLARQYPGVIQELGLDRRQADEFFDLLTDQQMRATEQMEQLWDVDPTEKPDQAAMQERQREIQRISSELQRKSEAELAARFGQEKAQAWKDYQSTMGARYQLDQMRTTLEAQGVPLTGDSSKPILKALAEAQQAEVKEYMSAMNRGVPPAAAQVGKQAASETNLMERHLEDTRKRNQRMLDAISSYLTFEQRTAIEQEQEAQLKMQEAQLRLMRARGNTSANGMFYSEGNEQIIMLPQ